MNKRQAKKFLRNLRRPPENFLSDKQSPRAREAWRKAKGRWSPWKMRTIKMTFSVTRKEVGSTLQSRVAEDIMTEEDRRIVQVLEEATPRYRSP